LSALDICHIKPLIGSNLRAELGDLVAGTHAAQLRALLIERGVIVFRDLPVTLDQQRAITETLGPVRADNQGDALQKVTIDHAISPEYAAYFANTLFWHMDGYHDQTVPCFGGSFVPARLAPEGGETEFLSAYAAYEGLSEADRELIDGLQVVHTSLTSGLAGNPQASNPEIGAWLERPPAVQPLVWQHLSGRKSLMLAVAVSHVVGMHPSDSYDLLARLRQHMGQSQFVYRHDWREHDLVIWNNTGTMHRARPFDPASGRLLHRFTIDGDEAISAPV
jgi:alpha-ketoglutarate-dependent taurine dioxygenase